METIQIGKKSLYGMNQKYFLYSCEMSALDQKYFVYSSEFSASMMTE